MPETKKISPATLSQWQKLADAWDAALSRLQRATTDQEAARLAPAEQRAYDALVDFVEANDLNYTEYDPREHGGQ